jgi:hypothetical protein
MKTRQAEERKFFALLAILAVLLVPAALGAQEQPTQHGSVELGVRGMTGDVDGRRDLQTSTPLSLQTSRLNEYRDLKNGLFLRNLQASFDHILGSNYFTIQSQNSLFNDQSWLATFGQYGKFKVQFRYDETPHIFSNTTRSLFAWSAGAYRLSPGIRNQLWGAANINPTLITNTYDPAVATAANAVLMPSLASAANAVASADPFTNTALVRKGAAAGINFGPSPNWNVSFLFSRERETGTRPIGLALGGGVEAPEPIDYRTDVYKAGGEYGRERWGVQFGYQGTTFENYNSTLTIDNPFSPAPNTALNLGGQCPTVAAACVTSTANGDIPKTVLNIGGKNYTISSVTGQGKMDLYPNNRADSLSFAGAFDLMKNVRVMASIVPGWMKQNDPFLPYTTNLTAGASPALPAASANAEKQTLAMNYTLTSHPRKDVELTARYRSYDYNNNTPVLDLTPISNDAAVGTLSHTANTPWSYFRKNAELTATYFLNKKNSVKVGYELEMMDREHREVSHTQENTLAASADMNPNKDLLLRVSYRHSDRISDLFDYESDDPNYAFAQVADSRRFDEAPRLRNRAEALVQYSPQAFQKLTLSASFGTTQDNYNRRVNNETAAGTIAGMGSFYAYGLLKDFSRNYSFDASYAATSAVSVFADYTRENYSTRMAARQLGSLVLSCATLSGGVCIKAGPSTAIYDPINDYTSFNKNLVDTWGVGLDGDLSKKVSFSTFYSLSAAKGNTFNAGVNCAIGSVACRTGNTHWFLDGPVLDGSGAIMLNPNNPAKDASGAVIPGVFLPYNSQPPLFYGGGPTAGNYGLNYPETVSRLHEISATIKFKLTQNLIPKLEYRFEKFTNVDYQTDASLVQGMNPYMFTGAAVDPNDSRGTSKYLFLGASSPSYHAHIVSATLEYHF